MARRRHENGLKYQQRIQSESRRAGQTDRHDEPDDRKREPAPPAPVPPGVTQLLENVAPPLLAPKED